MRPRILQSSFGAHAVLPVRAWLFFSRQCLSHHRRLRSLRSRLLLCGQRAGMHSVRSEFARAPPEWASHRLKRGLHGHERQHMRPVRCRLFQGRGGRCLLHGVSGGEVRCARRRGVLELPLKLKLGVGEHHGRGLYMRAWLHGRQRRHVRPVRRRNIQGSAGECLVHGVSAGVIRCARGCALLELPFELKLGGGRHRKRGLHMRAGLHGLGQAGLCSLSRRSVQDRDGEHVVCGMPSRYVQRRSWEHRVHSLPPPVQFFCGEPLSDKLHRAPARETNPRKHEDTDPGVSCRYTIRPPRRLAGERRGACKSHLQRHQGLPRRAWRNRGRSGCRGGRRSGCSSARMCCDVCRVSGNHHDNSGSRTDPL